MKFKVGDYVFSEGELCRITDIYGNSCELIIPNGLTFMALLEDLTPAHFTKTELFKSLNGGFDE